jgi:hypothetical protein
MGAKRIAYRIFIGKPKGKRPIGRQRYRWVDTSKINLRGIRWGDINWIDLAQNREQWTTLVNTVINFLVP